MTRLIADPPATYPFEVWEHVGRSGHPLGDIKGTGALVIKPAGWEGSHLHALRGCFSTREEALAYIAQHVPVLPRSDDEAKAQEGIVLVVAKEHVELVARALDARAEGFTDTSPQWRGRAAYLRELAAELRGGGRWR